MSDETTSRVVVVTLWLFSLAVMWVLGEHFGAGMVGLLVAFAVLCAFGAAAELEKECERRGAEMSEERSGDE